MNLKKNSGKDQSVQFCDLLHRCVNPDWVVLWRNRSIDPWNKIKTSNKYAQLIFFYNVKTTKQEEKNPCDTNLSKEFLD